MITAAVGGRATSPLACRSDLPPVLRHRNTQLLDRFELESGEVLRDLRQAYYFDGTLDAARENLVVVFHALTGSADAAGEWWSEVVGPARAIDTRRHAVLCVNLLGSCYGTTGAWEAHRRPFPRVTTRDMARLAHQLVRSLNVSSVALAVGGSLGGMVALEYAASFPNETRRAVVLAAPAAHTASAIGWSHIQRRAIAAAGAEGLEIARMMAMMTYRTPHELAARFGRELHPDGHFQVAGYLTRHGQKLRDRFDVHSYLTLLDAMDTHDVARGRRGLAATLGVLGERLTGVGIPGDLLYSADDVLAWTSEAGAGYREIVSDHGHDAFLLEHQQVSRLIENVLAAESSATHGQSRPWGDSRRLG